MNLQLDPFTLAVFAVACACLGWGALQLHAMESRHERDGALPTLAWGMALQALASALLLAAGLWRQPWCTVLALPLFATALLLWLAGVRRISRRAPRLDWLALLVPLALLAGLAHALLFPEPHWDLLIAAATQLLPIVLLIRELRLGRVAGEMNVVRRATIVVLALHGLAQLLLAGGALAGQLPLAPPGPLLLWLDLLVFNVCLPLCLLLLSANLLRARLGSLVRHDALTGLFNRRGMEEAAQRDIRRARKREVRLGLVVFGLERFRMVNEHYGFAAGDAALRAFAHELKAAAPAGSCTGRIGGEEFCLLVELDGASIAPLLSRLDPLLSGVDVEFGDAAIRLQATLGSAVLGSDGDDFDQLLQTARERLAERRKRNSVPPPPRDGGRDNYTVSEATINQLQLAMPRPALP
ncbi:GGDEF domain-containing protein [Chitinilyticum litopenaei]|uniref:GGDEF domain-containing protein n=1 Tax=Chitinilyticum litopenaei TaxID=1121276 RepID=UPI0011872EC0|nr:GGDEF domain-containing protein [Chitinilyticum litopenaei]